MYNHFLTKGRAVLRPSFSYSLITFVTLFIALTIFRNEIIFQVEAN